MNQPTNIKVALIIVGTILSFYFYYYLAHSTYFSHFISDKFKHSKHSHHLFLGKKTLGFIFMGLIPGIIYFSFFDTHIDHFGLTIKNISKSLGLTSVLGIVILFAVFSNQKLNPQNNSLQLNIKIWNTRYFFINAFGWIIYLTAYEFLFRGILLFECRNSFGFWPAIAINLAIYSSIHMINGKKQALGALLFGFIACYFTLLRETLIIPIMMHIMLSLGSDFFSIKLNKELTFERKQKPVKSI